MPSTVNFRWLDALNAVSIVSPGRIEGHQPYIINKASHLIWRSYNWICYISPLPPFWLSPGMNTYGSPVYELPTDFHALLSAYIWNIEDQTVEQELKILRDRQASETSCYFPDIITYDRATRYLRFYPGVSDSIDNCTYLVKGSYKKYYDRVEADNLTSLVIPFPHIYFPAVQKVVEWALLDYIKDPRAGEIQTDNNNRIISANGSLAQALNAINSIAFDEGMSLGNNTVSPDEPFFENVYT